MTLLDIQTLAEAGAVSITVRSEKVILDGPDDAVDQLVPLVRKWKIELIKLLTGETIGDVGKCDHCSGDLLGLLIHGGYVNRVCPHCGRWAICLPPDWTPEEVVELVSERAAIMQYQGGLSYHEAATEAVQAVKLQIDEQKRIPESADGVYKRGRQSCRTGDQVTQLSEELSNNE